MICLIDSMFMILLLLLNVVVVAVIEEDNIITSCRPVDARISSDGQICLSCIESCTDEMMCCKEIDCEQKNDSCDHLTSDGSVWHYLEHNSYNTTNPPRTVCCPPECKAYQYDKNLCTRCNYHDACPVPSIILASVYSNPFNESHPDEGNDNDDNWDKNNNNNITNFIDSLTTTPIDFSDESGKNQQETFPFMSSNEVRADGRSGGFVAGIVIMVLLLHAILVTVLIFIVSARFKDLNKRTLSAVKYPEVTEETESTAEESPAEITVPNSPNQNNRGNHVPQNNLSRILIGVYAVLILLSWIFVVAATSSCQFLFVVLKSNGNGKSYPHSDKDIQINSIGAIDKIGTGLFNYENEQGKCDRYPKYFKDNFMDPPLRAARFFAILSCLLLTTVIVFILLSFFMKRWKNSIYNRRCEMIQVIILYCSIWTAIFMFFASGSDFCHTKMEFGCSLGATGKLTIITVLVLIATTVIGTFLFFTNPAASVPNDDDDSSESSQNANEIEVDEEEAGTESKDEDKSLKSSQSVPGHVVWLKQLDKDRDTLVKRESMDSSDNSILSTKCVV